jgi:hypothetical protein
MLLYCFAGMLLNQAGPAVNLGAANVQMFYSTNTEAQTQVGLHWYL